MRLVRTCLPPLLLALVQVALWPGLAYVDGLRPDRIGLAAGLLAPVLAAVALGWRRRAPVATFAVVFAVASVAAVAVPRDAADSLLWCFGLVALYSVAVHRGSRAALVASGVLVGQETVRHGLVGPGFSVARLVGDAVVSIMLCLLLVALGRIWWRWREGRAAAARRLADAEEDRRKAATVERSRLARELHDVTAHHLTSIVVTASAAQRLTQRPKLLGEALEFAARTGRETVTALHRLVAVMDAVDTDPAPAPLPARIEELAAGFRRLGEPVTVAVELAEPMPPKIDEAGYAVVREALTNALRYARGAPVTVRVDRHGDALDVTVDNDAAEQPAAETVPGSGRGLAGLRERIAGLGGEVHAGARPDGGWTVRAVVPTGSPAAAPAATGRGRPRRLMDTSLVLATVVVPVGSVVSMQAETGSTDADVVAMSRPPTLALLTLFLLVSALPLILRRRAPWPVFAVVVAAHGLWPAAVALELMPQILAVWPATGALWIATYAVAVRARPAWLSWLPVPIGASVTALTMVGALVQDGSLLYEPVHAGSVLVATFIVGTCTGLLLLALFGAGFAVRLRRRDILSREDRALAEATALAEYAARTERARIAAGLRDSVLDRTGRLVATADLGVAALSDGDVSSGRQRLDETVAEARGALAAMRDLLDTLRGGQAAADRTPQPTTATIEQLCDEHRRAGRPVTLTAEAGPQRVPAEVDVSTYRVVEAALGAGDTGPARVGVGYGHDEVRITVTGVPAAAAGPVAAGLRARVAALGGRIAVDAGGSFDVTLPITTLPITTPPITPEPALMEEVTPSSSG